MRIEINLSHLKKIGNAEENFGSCSGDIKRHIAETIERSAGLLKFPEEEDLIRINAQKM